MKSMTLGMATGVALAAILVGGTQSSRADEDAEVCTLTAGETDMKGVSKQDFDVGGRECDIVSNNVKKKNKAHFSGNAKLDEYCTDAKGKITKARVVVSGSINVPAWTDEDDAKESHKEFIKSYIAWLGAHERRHASNLTSALAGAHSKVVGKTAAEAEALLAKLECDAARADVALDKKEGKVTVTLKSNDTCEQTISGADHPEYLANCK
jgi:hypothetical protein